MLSRASLRGPGLLLLSLSLALATAVGCGGDDQPKYTVQQAEDILREASVRAEDIRVTMVQTARQPVGINEMAELSALLSEQEARALIEKSKPMVGYLVDFASSPTEQQLAGGWVINIHQELTFHESVEGAQAALASALDQRQDASQQMLEILGSDPQLRDVAEVTRPDPLIGDEAFAVRIAADMAPSTRRYPLVHDLVYFRRGEVSVFMVLIATQDREPLLEMILTKADERLQLALEAGPPLE